MSKHNYSQYSNKKNDSADSVTRPKLAPIDLPDEVFVAPEVKREVETAPELVIETVETVAKPETVKGTVFNCARLNVRAEPSVDGDVVCVLNVASEIEVNVAKSTAEWFYVCTATGAEGYCMKKFVDARL